MDWQYSSFGWENHNCDSEMPFVCEVLAGIEPITTIPPPTEGPAVPCTAGTDDGWIKGSTNLDYCYKFVVTSDPAVGWPIAEAACQSEGGHLASSHSKDENNFLMVMFSRNTIAQGFIGLYFNDDGQYTWSDGSIPEYYKWNEGGIFNTSIYYILDRRDSKRPTFRAQ
jgi:hypothetical protein